MKSEFKNEQKQSKDGLSLDYSEKNIFRLAGFENYKNIQVLLLQNNHITKIENIEQCSSLKYLDLSQNQIQKVENLKANVKLETLLLNNNNIGDYQDILQLQYNLELKHLQLQGNPLFRGNRSLEDQIFSLCPYLIQFNQVKNLECVRDSSYETIIQKLQEQLKLSVNQREVLKQWRRICFVYLSKLGLLQLQSKKNQAEIQRKEDYFKTEIQRLQNQDQEKEQMVMQQKQNLAQKDEIFKQFLNQGFKTYLSNTENIFKKKIETVLLNCSSKIAMNDKKLKSIHSQITNLLQQQAVTSKNLSNLVTKYAPQTNFSGRSSKKPTISQLLSIIDEICSTFQQKNSETQVGNQLKINQLEMEMEQLRKQTYYQLQDKDQEIEKLTKSLNQTQKTLAAQEELLNQKLLEQKAFKIKYNELEEQTEGDGKLIFKQKQQISELKSDLERSLKEVQKKCDDQRFLLQERFDESQKQVKKQEKAIQELLENMQSLEQTKNLEKIHLEDELAENIIKNKKLQQSVSDFIKILESKEKLIKALKSQDQYQTNYQNTTIKSSRPPDKPLNSQKYFFQDQNFNQSFNQSESIKQELKRTDNITKLAQNLIDDDDLE